MQYGNEPCGIAALADLVSIKTGKLNSNAAVENGAYPFFTCSRETYKVDTYSFDCEAVLLAGNNANGVYPVKYHKGRFDAYQRTYVIRSVDERVLNNRYLFYALQLELDLLQSLSTGSATKFLTLTILNALKVRVPSLSDQNRIVSILGAYDDLIENNTRRIEILEEMARRLYDEWFVQFRFPGHEGVEFKESELGLIPEGWEVVALERAVEINPKTKVERDGEKVFVPMGALSETGMVVSGWEIKSGNSGAKFQNGDTLVARISPCLENGKTGFVDFLPASQPTACGSTEFIVLRSRSLCPEMVYCLSRSDRFREVAMKSMSGATGRQRVRVESLVGYPIAQPESELVAKYHAFAQPCFKEIRVLANKNANLRQQRDLLLPKLISGEIDVSDIPMPT